MKLVLRNVTNTDIKEYQSWIDNIKASQYMSRHYPKVFDGRTFARPGLLCWYIIVLNDRDIGTVWLEKESGEAKIATLGIMIGYEKEFGVGIGRKAIEIAISHAYTELGFRTVQLNVRKTNKRAIRCYQSCGFKIIDDRNKVNDLGETIGFLHMRLELGQKENVKCE